MRVFFDKALDNVATFWRVFRRDGVALGFTTHDRALFFDGVIHRASPGMTPSAIRRTSNISDDSAEVEGALSHEAIREIDLEAGLFDDARVEIGAVDWKTLENHVFYSGSLGQIRENGKSFSAELKSAKSLLEEDLVPRTSPTCRAAFCGPGCSLSATRFTHLAVIQTVDHDANRIAFNGMSPSQFLDGRVRFLEGPMSGLTLGVVTADDDGLVLDTPMVSSIIPGQLCEIIEGCDHTLATCTTRFDNAANFRGEPFLPGNDLLARYGQPQS